MTTFIDNNYSPKAQEFTYSTKIQAVNFYSTWSYWTCV